MSELAVNFYAQPSPKLTGDRCLGWWSWKTGSAGGCAVILCSLGFV